MLLPHVHIGTCTFPWWVNHGVQGTEIVGEGWRLAVILGSLSVVCGMLLSLVFILFIPLKMQTACSASSVLADVIPCLGGLCCNWAINLGWMGMVRARTVNYAWCV
jgi:hypothetical protein